MSCPMDKSWRVDEAQIAKYAKGGTDIVYLSCGYQETDEGGGVVGYKKMLLYGKRVRWGGAGIVIIYASPRLGEISEEDRQYLATRVVITEILKGEGENVGRARAVGMEAAQEAIPAVVIAPWRGR